MAKLVLISWINSLDSLASLTIDLATLRLSGWLSHSLHGLECELPSMIIGYSSRCGRIMLCAHIALLWLTTEHIDTVTMNSALWFDSRSYWLLLIVVPMIMVKMRLRIDRRLTSISDSTVSLCTSLSHSPWCCGDRLATCTSCLIVSALPFVCKEWLLHHCFSWAWHWVLSRHWRLAGWLWLKLMFNCNWVASGSRWLLVV